MLGCPLIARSIDKNGLQDNRRLWQHLCDAVIDCCPSTRCFVSILAGVWILRCAISFITSSNSSQVCKCIFIRTTYTRGAMCSFCFNEMLCYRKTILKDVQNEMALFQTATKLRSHVSSKFCFELSGIRIKIIFSLNIIAIGKDSFQKNKSQLRTNRAWINHTQPV